MIKIDKNVPVPNGADCDEKPETYPFAEMKVGDSFFVGCKDSWQLLTQSSLELAMLAYMNKFNVGAKFTARAVLGGVRVWRVK